MSAATETAFTQGQRQVWQQLMTQCLRELGYEPPEVNALRWVIEREAAIQSLRSLCREFGDNEWDTDLHLQDIIEKHLGDHLRAPIK